MFGLSPSAAASHAPLLHPTHHHLPLPACSTFFFSFLTLPHHHTHFLALGSRACLLCTIHMAPTHFPPPSLLQLCLRKRLNTFPLSLFSSSALLVFSLALSFQEQDETVVITKVEVVSPIDAVLSEYFLSGDIPETLKSIQELNLGIHTHTRTHARIPMKVASSCLKCQAFSLLHHNKHLNSSPFAFFLLSLSSLLSLSPPLLSFLSPFLSSGDNQQQFIKKAVARGLEKQAYERELVSKLLSAVYRAAIAPEKIAEGFEVALVCVLTGFFCAFLCLLFTFFFATLSFSSFPPLHQRQ